MKKETIEIKAAYVAPEVCIHEVRPQGAVCGSIDGYSIDWFEEDGDELEC